MGSQVELQFNNRFQIGNLKLLNRRRRRVGSIFRLYEARLLHRRRLRLRRSSRNWRKMFENLITVIVARSSPLFCILVELILPSRQVRRFETEKKHLSIIMKNPNVPLDGALHPIKGRLVCPYQNDMKHGSSRGGSCSTRGYVDCVYIIATKEQSFRKIFPNEFREVTSWVESSKSRGICEGNRVLQILGGESLSNE